MSRGPTTPVGKYPQTRMRRNRRHEWSRRMVRENILSSSDLILPIFISNEMGKLEKIDSMPGVFRHSIDLISDIVGEAIFLSSNESDFINGSEIKIDGGWLAAKTREGEL